MAGLRSKDGSSSEIEGLVEAIGRPKNSLCRACFDGEYPTPVPDAQLMGQQIGEITPISSLVATLPSAGAGDALDRP